MATLNAQEVQSVVRPPFFDEGVDLWDVIENGPFNPTKIVDGVHSAKPKGEWSEQEKIRVALNDKLIPKRIFKKDKGESSKRDPPICFECNKPSHIRTDCPKLKKPFKKFKKKALKAIWDESSDSEDEEIGDQVAQMCFMAIEESSNEVTLNDDAVEFSYDELVNALKVMNDELELSHKKNKLLKKEVVCLKKENETLTKDDKPLGDDMQKSLEDLSLENEKLKNEITELKTFLSKFAKGKDKLDAILDSQRSPSIKYRLGYSKFAQAPPSKTIFFKASSSNEPSPQVPSPKVSNLKGQERKKFCGNETRKTSFHQHSSRQNVCLKSSKLESKWCLYSGCLRHMTRNANLFLSLEKKDGGGQVTFGDNGKGKIVGIGKVGKENSPILDKVLLVDGSKHNLLSVSQLCDKGCRVVFKSKSCFVSRMSDNKMLFIGKRIENIYVIDLHALSNKDAKCFVSISDDSWTWHRRLAHASMDLLVNLNKDELVDRLLKIKF
ncbi:uncharacterized protein LOC131171239 [Hevea brasiliensis]|uniref:uncharacterized protein LOC131171239 n=1 Tax=Hevea brasiliensis TaxID=3981 RepID=UPI0025CEEC1B|nr:uncharacterized protein LOC131171239 [Hevea brasiliensis]